MVYLKSAWFFSWAGWNITALFLSHLDGKVGTPREWWIARSNFNPFHQVRLHTFLMISGPRGFISLWRTGCWVAAKTTRTFFSWKNVSITFHRGQSQGQGAHSRTTTPLTHPLFGCSGQSPGGCLADRPLLWTRRQGCLGQARLSLRRWRQLQKPLGRVLLLWGWHSRLDSHPESASSCLWWGHSGRHLCSCNKTSRRSETALRIVQPGLFEYTCLLPLEIDLLTPGSSSFSHGRKSICTCQPNEWMTWKNNF